MDVDGPKTAFSFRVMQPEQEPEDVAAHFRFHLVNSGRCPALKARARDAAEDRDREGRNVTGTGCKQTSLSC